LRRWPNNQATGCALITFPVRGDGWKPLGVVQFGFARGSAVGLLVRRSMHEDYAEENRFDSKGSEKEAARGREPSRRADR
jgi:hypothetical protein